VVFHPSPRTEIGTYDLTANHFVIKDYDIFERGRIRGLISYCEYNGYYRVPTDYVTDNEYVTSPMMKIRSCGSKIITTNHCYCLKLFIYLSAGPDDMQVDLSRGTRDSTIIIYVSLLCKLAHSGNGISTEIRKDKSRI